MRIYLGALIFLMFTGLFTFSQVPSTLEKDATGWLDLLSDRSLGSWTRVAVPPTAALAEVSPWSIDPGSGVLVCRGDKSGHEMLRHNREFADFVYHVEYRFTPVAGDAKYNSGVYARNNSDGSIWHQAQAGSSSGGYIFGNSPVNGIVQRFNLRDKMTENRVKPAGEWNISEIHADGRKLSLWVNGAVTSEFDQCEVLRGFVALEAEGYRIEFRNVKIKENR